jgi:hypothetical protein
MKVQFYCFEDDTPELKRKRAHSIEQVNTLLLLYWNPIMGHVPTDEYSDYAKLLVSEYMDVTGFFGFPNANCIAHRLEQFARGMGVGDCTKKAQAVAAILFERFPRKAKAFTRLQWDFSGDEPHMWDREPATCNLCGESCLLPLPGGDAHGTSNHGLIRALVTGGYFSHPGRFSGALEDMTAYQFSICEFCLDWLFCQAKIPPRTFCWSGYDEGFEWQSGEDIAKESEKNDTGALEAFRKESQRRAELRNKKGLS